MPLRLRIENVQSLPDGGPVEYEVDRRGLDIGRDAYLDWSLPDPERFISGKHCEVRYRDGGYWLHDVSTNGTSVNWRGGRLTEPHRLETGDRVHVGQYIIAVDVSGEEPAAAAAPAAATAGAGGGDDPWGVADAAAAVDRRDFAARVRAEAGRAPSSGPADLAEENISWGVGSVSAAPTASDDDIWGAPPAAGSGAAADEWGWTPPAPAASPRGPAQSDPAQSDPAQSDPAPSSRSDAVGPDWRADLVRETSGPDAANPAPVQDRPQPPAADAPGQPAPPPGEEPAARAPEPAPLSGRPAPHADPLADLADAAAGPRPAQPRAADPSLAPAQPAPQAGRPAPHADPFADLAGAAAPAAAPQPAAQPAPQPFEPAPAPASAGGLASRWSDGAEAQAPEPHAQPHPAPARAQGGQGGGFVAAFERGAGMPAGSVVERGEEAFAEELGALFRMVTQNLQAMLAARAETKSAMRSSERTMIGALENNPLKFSPTPEDALRIMFGARSRSYLDATKTVESSFHDLQKHQMQTFGAMQQALQALIEDLDPKSIEEATSKDGGLAGIVGSRRAKYWDTYVERFRAKSGRHERGMIDAFMILFAEMYDRQR